MRNTLEHAGSFSRRRAALVSSEQSAGSPSFPVCEKTALPTKKKTDNKKKKHQFQSSRISCYSCNAPATVSATSMRMRKTNRVCCVKCYPLLKKIGGMQETDCVTQIKIQQVEKYKKQYQEEIRSKLPEDRFVNQYSSYKLH